ncbi:MAG: 3-isopropylmalate dehydratase small subunit [Methylococcaceae bacterium]|nr:3-isopropylmalate dehydratase small subunit [Methylococcaceae bacterium]
MEPFQQIHSKVVPMDRANVDTDAIMPKQFLKSIRRSGFGPYLFDGWRYLDRGEPDMDCTNRPLNPDFELNRPGYQGARILLVRENFGCGSSREHAPWALQDYGFRVLIGPSFADIFYNNCFKNGLLPIRLEPQEVDRLFQEAANPDYRLTVDLEQQSVMTPDRSVLRFEIDESRKYRLLHGLDDIDLTLQYADEIRRYESGRIKKAPWLFRSLTDRPSAAGAIDPAAPENDHR